MCETNDNNKICVMFGAGAEISYGLSGGGNFAKTIIASEKDNDTSVQQMNDAINDYYDKELNEWYPSYNENYTFKPEKLFEAALKKEWMDTEQTLDTKSAFDKLIQDELTNRKDEKNEIIDQYTSYMGILDEKFHTIISPKYLGPQKFWGVVACYARAYLLLTGEMVKKTEKQALTKKDYCDMLENPLKYYEKWKNIHSKDSYYEIIKNCSKAGNNVSVVTTNYTPICEDVTGIKDIAYVNGRLNWFESPYELKVYDITQESQKPAKDDIWFPYIFIQSGVKPIIEEKQITEYGKMIKYLNRAETIIIVGYRINADDNHINSFLRSSVLSGKKVIYFNHNSELTDEQVYRRLRLDKIKDNIKNIEIVKTNDKNCILKFREILCDNIENSKIKE